MRSIHVWLPFLTDTKQILTAGDIHRWVTWSCWNVQHLPWNSVTDCVWKRSTMLCFQIAPKPKRTRAVEDKTFDLFVSCTKLPRPFAKPSSRACKPLVQDQCVCSRPSYVELKKCCSDTHVLHVTDRWISTRFAISQSSPSPTPSGGIWHWLQIHTLLAPLPAVVTVTLTEYSSWRITEEASKQRSGQKKQQQQKKH